MPPKARPEATPRFGVFEVDLRAGQLRKQGMRVKLQEQPFRVLTELLQHPGEVVTREELRLAIWPADTFVDFDNSLNTAVNKLREALGDSSDSPRFIETLPRRGYRFIAPVTGNDQKTGTQPIAVSHALSWKIVLSVSLPAILGLIVGGLIWHSQQKPHFKESSTIVVGDFANLTGDGVFDGTLRQGLSVQLQQSPFLKLVSEEQIYRTLRMMGQKPNARLTPEVAREVCQRTNSAATLDGSVALIGTRYDLILRAMDCATGDLLASTEAQANDKSGVLDSLSRLASEMRRKLGESLGTVEKNDIPLEEATTPSLEALRSYSLGDENLRQTGDFGSFLPFYQKAIELDPNFAMAYFAIGDSYSALGETILSADYLRKAFELRARVSEPERLYIEVDYYFYVTGDLTKARQSSELMARMHPRDTFAHTMLWAYSIVLGRYEEGLGECLKVLRLDPFDSNAYRNATLTYLLLNRVEDASTTAQEAHAKGLDSSLTSVLYGLTFYRGDIAGLSRQVAVALGKPGQEDLLFALQADTAAYFGHIRDARELSHRAVDSAERFGEKENAAGYYAVSALRDALLGDAYKARQEARIAERYSRGRDVDYGLALALAYADAVDRAQILANTLDKRFPEDTVVHSNYLPVLRAKLALAHSNPQQALDALAVAAPYELGFPAESFYNWPNLYPAYVRGEAYLDAHQGDKAAVEFQKILDHRGIVGNETIGALAHLQIGRAYAMAGDTAKAKAAYNDFLTLWKDADADIPILKQAKAEYAKLQ